jgi:hypothetical protein
LGCVRIGGGKVRKEMALRIWGKERGGDASRKDRCI